MILFKPDACPIRPALPGHNFPRAEDRPAFRSEVHLPASREQLYE